jgi:PAS domain S-box-containing protein
MSLLGEIGSTAGRTAQPAGATPAPDGYYCSYEREVYRRAHKLFRLALGAQWVCSVLVAWWIGGRGFPPALWITVLVGAVATIPAAVLTQKRPNDAGTRYVVALSQIGYSLLFIWLSSGRLEAHFHIFGSLALLALYRDWRLLLVASVPVWIHHAWFGLMAPHAIFNHPEATGWRALEHGCWLAFADAVLACACLISRNEMREVCAAQAQHQALLADMERRIRERTGALENEIAEREKAAAALRASDRQHRELLSRLPIGIFETTRSGRIRYANSHALGLVGLPAHIDPTAISLADGSIFPLRERERLWRQLETRGEVRGFESTCLHFDGSPFDVVINARLKQGPPGEELAAEGTFEDVSLRKRAERELETLHNQLMIASRQAGMAEVATGVLHNVGNVLTSVNLIVHDVQDRLKASRISHLHRVVEILARERDHLGTFLTEDATGRQVPEFLTKLDEHLADENRRLLADVDGLVRHFEHIREIIVTQQGSAQMFGVIEVLAPSQLIDDALRLNAESRERHGIALERSVTTTQSVKADRHRVLQILVNLMRNAKDALLTRKPSERRIRVTVTAADGDHVAISVEDNGAGIAAENLTRIFQHGYTTKPTGHGFGLHSSVLAAREMGGDLTATSAGRGQGATFTLKLPAAS